MAAEDEPTKAAAEAKRLAKKAKKALKKKDKKNKASKEGKEEGGGGGGGGGGEAVEEPAAAEEKKKKSKKDKKKAKKEGGEQAEEAAVVAPKPTLEAGEDGDKKSKKKKRKRAEADAAAAAAAAGGEEKKKKKKSKKDKAGSNSNGAETKGDAEAGKKSVDEVTVEGMKVVPIDTFEAAGFPEPTIRYCTSRKWTTLTPIQRYCWPVLKEGRDIIGIAETGSGKTIAFSIPGLARQLNDRKTKGPFMLVLAPTRELALQSAEVVTEVGKDCGISCVCVYGGVPKYPQKAALRSVAKSNGIVIIATPGRLKDLIQDGACDLSKVNYLVLDEADRMLDLGFEDDVREIAKMTSSDRQTAMFSATWPKSIRDLAEEFLTNPVKVTVGDDDLTANARVTQTVEVVDERARDKRLLELLKQFHSKRDNRILVFALYKKEAGRIETMLQRNGFDACAVHGDKGQADREKALGQFKTKACPLMVATDVAARGLDIPDVEYVINYSFPLTIEDYIHRIGRTGRAGKTGVSHTFFHQGDKARGGELVNVLREANQVVPEALTKFGTHVKKKEHKTYGAFYRDIGTDKKATKITFDDSD